VRFFLFDVFQYGLAHRPEGVAGVENVKDDVGGIDDLVEFAVYPSRGAFSVDGLVIVGVCLRLNDRRCEALC
jgi:hypothetical protein